MYQPFTDEKLEEKYHGQMDDTSDTQYAYDYGMRLYEIGKSHNLETIALAEVVVYWLQRYIDQEENVEECVEECHRVVDELLEKYPELKNINE